LAAIVEEMARRRSATCKNVAIMNQNEAIIELTKRVVMIADNWPIYLT